MQTCGRIAPMLSAPSLGALRHGNAVYRYMQEQSPVTASLVRMTARTSCNAYQKKNISIAKTTTSTSTIAILVTLEVTIAHLITPNATSRRTRTTRRKLSQLEVTARIEARNNLISERTLYALTTMRTMTMTSILPMMTTMSSRNAPLNAQKTPRAPSQPVTRSGTTSATFSTLFPRI